MGGRWRVAGRGQAGSRVGGGLPWSALGLPAAFQQTLFFEKTLLEYNQGSAEAGLLGIQ